MAALDFTPHAGWATSRWLKPSSNAAGSPVESRDPIHLSTPLGWAAFGSVHRKADGGDYPAVVDRLVAAGADISAPGNGEPLSLIAMAEGNPVVQAALRRHGAKE